MNSKEQTGKEVKSALGVGPAEYIETKYGTRAFARSLRLDDAASIMDLMQDFSDYNSAALQKRISDLESILQGDTRYEETMVLEQRISDLESQIQDLEPKFTELEMDCKRLKAELKRKDEALGFGEAWPLPDVLMKLVESTEYLLHVKNYDRTGWEEVSHCTKLGRQYVDKINAVIAEQALKPKDI